MSKTTTKKIEAVHKITGYKHTFDYKEISDFETIEEYITFALDMYLKNYWAFYKYRNEVKSKDESEITDEDLVAFAILDAYQEHCYKTAVPDYSRRLHLSLNSDMTKTLRGIIRGNKE